MVVLDINKMREGGMRMKKNEKLWDKLRDVDNCDKREELEIPIDQIPMLLKVCLI